MPLLSDIAQREKIRFFLEPIPEDAAILEVGCGSGWVGEYFRKQRSADYRGIDLVPPADIVGDIQDWKSLGLEEASFDYLIAFEVVEHVDIYPSCAALLKPGGKLLVTTPVPHFDWIMKMLEWMNLNQRRTSPHSNLHYLEDCGELRLVSKRNVAGLSQWGIFEKAD